MRKLKIGRVESISDYIYRAQNDLRVPSGFVPFILVPAILVGLDGAEEYSDIVKRLETRIGPQASNPIGIDELARVLTEGKLNYVL